jgi:hypothetical protein
MVRPDPRPNSLTIPRRRLNKSMTEKFDEQSLTEFALKRCDETAADEEQHSFIFRTEGAFDVGFCSWDVFEHEEFDGDLSDLDLSWSDQRKRELETGLADPTPRELDEWRRAQTERAARDCREIAWFTPLSPSGSVVGWAFFLCLT